VTGKIVNPMDVEPKRKLKAEKKSNPTWKVKGRDQTNRQPSKKRDNGEKMDRIRRYAHKKPYKIWGAGALRGWGLALFGPVRIVFKHR